MTARILIVDDVAANARILEAKLSADYYQVAIGQDGFEALRLAYTWQPDVILLDVAMPELDGFETCLRLKADAMTRHIPVLMVMKLDDAEDRLRGIEAGAEDVLTEPVEYPMLLARVRSLARIKRVLDELRMRGDTARSLGLAGDMVAVPSVSGARALVIDDCDAGGERVQAALAREGILVGRASSDAETMALTAAIPFDLIVLSLAMATDDPLRLAARLRAADATQDIPLLLLADAGQRERLLRGFELGANDWLARPVNEAELRARARNQIRRKFYQDGLRADMGYALEMALTDPLTGFYNQRYLRRHLGSLLAAGQPNGIAVLMVDVDHFKTVNDRWGHAVGDRALKAVADTLRARTRVFDSIARYGGEEFVVVMPGTAIEDAASAAERLRVAIETLPFMSQPGAEHRMTISVGVAFGVGDELNADLLLNAADHAMYTAKRSGRNRTAIAATLTRLSDETSRPLRRAD